MKRRVVIISDLHVGSTVGLWPGRHPIEGGGIYEANVFQQWLLRCWDVTKAEIQSMRPKPIVIGNGDIIQGTSAKDGQLVTSNKNIQTDAAYTLLKPVVEAARRYYQIRGTEWHEGKAAEDVEGLATRLGAARDPSTGQSTWWELFLALDPEDEDSPVAHFAHHVGASSVPWYEATVPLRDMLMFLAELWRFFGKAAPNVRLAVRSHRHRYIHVDVPPNLHVVVTPGYQLRTAFSFKRAAAMLPIVGYVVLEYSGRPGGREIIVRKRIFPLPIEYVHVEEF